MNRIPDFFRNIKLPKIKLPKIGLQRLSVRQIVVWGVVLAVTVGLFVFVRGFTACWRLTSLPGIPPASCAGEAVNLGGTLVFNPAGTAVANLPPTPEAVAPEVQYPQWDGGSRINILFVGLRGGDPALEDCPLCTDTLILLTVDPVTKTAGMLSIPRDMWVNIPGFGYSRINTAWTDGEGSKLPGGGPGLTMKTVSQFIGVPVQYYVQVDFNTFADLINYIGGVDVYSDENLILDIAGSGYDSLGKLAVNDTVSMVGRNSNSRFVLIEYAAGPNGKGWILSSAVQQAAGIDALPVVKNTGNATGTGMPGTINKVTDVRPAPGDPNKVRITSGGMRHLNGQVALAYARCRDVEQGCTDGDVGRAKRQQKVIFAIRDKVLSPEYFPKLMAQAPELYNTFSAGIHTNMPLEDAVKLAALAKDIRLDQIKNGVIDTSMITFDNVILGGQNASIMKPVPDKIRVLRDEIFTSGGPTSPIAQGDPTALMQADGARIRVTNNTYTADLDSRTGNYLVALGMQVADLGPSTGPSDQTVLVVYSPKLYALRFLIQVFGVSSSNQIVLKPDPSIGVDIEVRLGNDWAGRLPAGY